MREHLILDCYVKEPGGAENLVPLLGGAPHRVVRVVSDEVPSSSRDFAAIWISGSAASALDDEPWIRSLLALLRDAHQHATPALGICFGHQAIARALLGEDSVRRSETSELGWEDVEVTAAHPLLDALPRRFRCFVSHYDEVRVPDGRARVLARSARCEVQAFALADSPIYGVQFHPEMGPEESRRLVREGHQHHAHLPRDVEEVLARGVDSRDLGRGIARSFLELARRSSGSAT